VLLSLGEVCLESDNGKGAIDEFSKCIELRHEIGDLRDKCVCVVLCCSAALPTNGRVCAPSADVFSLMGLTYLTMANVDGDKRAQKVNYERSVDYYIRTRNAMIVRLQLALRGAVPDADQQGTVLKDLAAARLIDVDTVVAEEDVTFVSVLGKSFAALGLNTDGAQPVLDIASIIDDVDSKVTPCVVFIASTCSS
jgi:hypothetical protein